MERLKKTLRELVELHGAPGFEDMVRQYIECELKKWNVDHFVTDNIGNLYVEIKGTDPDSPIVHLDAHIDEPCFMVKYIDDRGYVYVTPLGLHAESVMVAQKVVIHTLDGPVYGAFGVKSFHLSSDEERRRGLAMEDIWIDVGAGSREQAEKMGIKQGMPVTYDGVLKDLANGCVMGKALDNRVGCAVLMETIKLLKENPPHTTILVTFSVQEELLLRGSHTIFKSFSKYFEELPTISLTYDVCAPGDFPGIPKHHAPIELHKGPGIKVYEKSRFSHYQHVVPRKLVETLTNVAMEHGIPYQLDFMTGCTNAGIFALQDTGVLAGGISLPCRYTHTPVEIVSLQDAENAVKLTLAFINQCSNYFKKI